MSQGTNESYLVKRGKYDSLTIYEVTVEELDILENGSSNTLLLNLSISFWSICVSFFIALISSTWKLEGEGNNLMTFIIFLGLCLTTGIAALICTLLWWKTEDNFKKIIKKIKERLVEEKAIDKGDADSIDVES